MCDHGDTIPIRVPIPAALGWTGQFRWVQKPVDRCIAPIVEALNAARIYTAGACCGHGNGPASIALHDGRTLTIGKEGET